MTDVNLIKIDGKPIEKLIEVISKGIGTLYRPRAIRKEAEAAAYRIEILGKAKRNAKKEGELLEYDTIERIEERIINKEYRRQKNIDNVAEFAAQELKREKTVSEKPVDEDWSTRFFNIVEDISDEEMQAIWGKILAGEVKKPKSYSLRTLEFLKNLSKDEALNFVKVAELAIFAAGKYFIFNPDKGKGLDEKFGISFTNILELNELGLLNPDPNLKISFDSAKTKNNISIVYQNKGIVFKRQKDTNSFSIRCIVFTSIGMELIQLIQKSPNLEYIKWIKDTYKSDKISIKLGDISERPNGEKIIVNIKEI